jgi:hypothetical protein
MINLNLTFEDYTSIEDLSIKEVNFNNYTISRKQDMETIINHFNMEFDWDLMYKIDDIENRLKSHHKLFILYYKSIPIGCMWFKTIDEETTHLYNLFVTKKETRPRFAPTWFVNICSKIMFNEYQNIRCECEEWNMAAQSVFLKNGFSVIS